jgi:WhiB family redox-sensing transcriptional regulator
MATTTSDAFCDADAGLILEILESSRPAWHADAACREAPYDVSWFEDGPYSQEQAKLICSRCLVAEECLAWADAEGPELAGVWGGLDRRERAARRRAQARARSVPLHGERESA